MFAEGDPMVTDRQRAILDYVRRFVEEHGYPPTVREIGEAVGLRSPSTVHAHLAQLERAGVLRRDPTKPRAIELADRRAPAELHVLPLVPHGFDQVAPDVAVTATANALSHAALARVLN